MQRKSLSVISKLQFTWWWKKNRLSVSSFIIFLISKSMNRSFGICSERVKNIRVRQNFKPLIFGGASTFAHQKLYLL